MIIVTTLMRIYQYIGAIANTEEKPLLQQVFYRYLNAQGIHKRNINNIKLRRKCFPSIVKKKLVRILWWKFKNVLLQLNIHMTNHINFCFILLLYLSKQKCVIVTESFSEVISSLPYSKMQFYYPSLGVIPKSFGWLTETGILYAQV